MNISIPWLRSRGASVAELEKQLVDANAAHKESLDAVSDARAAFHDDGSKAGVLLKAQEGERLAAVHVGRAECLLAEAKAKAQAEQRAKLLQRHDELRDQLTAEQLQKRRAPSLSLELDALKAVIEARIARQQVEVQIGEIETELKRVRVKLGEPEDAVYAGSFSLGSTSPSTRDVAEALEKEYRHFGTDDPRMRIVIALGRFLSH